MSVGFQGRMGTCGRCGREMKAGNLAWHQRGECRVWDPEGGQSPDGCRRPKWVDWMVASWRRALTP